jgi:acylphosphatase
MRAARHFLITGRVQGVGYRWFAREAAVREGVTGWVRNLPDGCVEAVAEGELESLTRLERALRRGPPSARVEAVDVDDSQPATGRYADFSVR